MANYQKLQVFDLAHQLAVDLFHVTVHLPRPIKGELGDQLRRASLSVPANIVEGCGRMRDPDMLRHFRISLGSAGEVEYLLMYARDTKVIHPKLGHELHARASSIRRMVAALILSIENRKPDPEEEPEPPSPPEPPK